MDIESKRYRVRSALGADVEILDKSTGATRYRPRSALPHLGELAAMTESRFDSIMAAA